MTLVLSACVSAEPSLVARAVEATLTAVHTPTPIVVVVTAMGGPEISTVTPDMSAQQTLAAATQTVAAQTATVVPASASEAASPTAAVLPTSASQSPSATATLAPTRASATASPTPTVRTTPTVSSTPGPSVTPAPVSDVLFEDHFIDPNLWLLGDDSAFRATIADGQLSITLKAADLYRFTPTYGANRRAGDFYAVVTGTSGVCRFRDRYGLLFRWQDKSNYYQFDVDCDGRYRLSKMVAGTLTALQDWTKNDAVHRGSGATNALGVRAQGDTLAVLANDQSLASVSDSTFAEGGFGLYAGSGLSETYTAVFDDLRVWKLK